MYFWDNIMLYWLISTSKCQYLESYDIKRDFRDFKFYNLVQSTKNTDLDKIFREHLRGFSFATKVVKENKLSYRYYRKNL